ncbi:hypothetical protein K439DRAFT_1625610 [Ramaria rubella]|nr:hypothetical protein K439DRAFT_1625610 [Ramaria rubella]
MAAVDLVSPRIDTPPPKAIPSVLVAPLFGKGVLTEDLTDEAVDQLAHDDIAIIPQHKAKFLGGVGITDTHWIAMPAEYSDGWAYHIAGVVYVDGVIIENEKKYEMCTHHGYWCYGLPGSKHTKRQTAEASVLTAAAKGKGKAVVKPVQSIVPLELAAITGPSLLPLIPSTRSQPSRDTKRSLDLVPNSSPGESPICPSNTLQSLQDSMVEGADWMDRLAQQWIIANNAVMGVQKEMLEVQAWMRNINKKLEKFL